MDLPSHEIDQAITRIRGGDKASFEPIVRRYERPLRTWLAVQAGPGIDVDEVAQRAFVAAYTRLDDYQLGTDFGAWLFSIARYQLKTETTQRRRIADYRSRFGPDLIQKELDRFETEPPAMQVDRLDHLKSCLESLSEGLRQFVQWRYDDEIPLAEMAQRSQRSIPAVKKQLWKLRRKLHDCIESKMLAKGGSS